MDGKSVVFRRVFLTVEKYANFFGFIWVAGRGVRIWFVVRMGAC
jgi:hypothetical protein